MKEDDERKLEQIFLHAVHEPAYRPDFLEKLLEANIYCIRYSNENMPRALSEKDLNEEQSISLKIWTDTEYGQIIPFFTSLNKLRKIAEEDESFICLPCRILFEITLGAHLILNPKSEAVKEFHPNEIKGILLGDYEQYFESYELIEDSSFYINQPEKYPYFMVEQLKQFFSTELHIIAAYLAQIYDTEIDEKPSLLIGLELNRNLSTYYVNELHYKISQIAYAALDEKVVVNVVYLDLQEDPINLYFREEIEPFYLRLKENSPSFFDKLFS
jgi:hypothetical protein